MTQLGLVFDGIDSGARLSPERLYRWELWRIWDRTKPLLVWIMLNPSTADALLNDPTIKACMAFARLLGFGGIIVVNEFAFRATSPAVMKAAADPVGAENDEAIRGVLRRRDVGMVIAAWGAHGTFRGRDREVIAMALDAGHDLHALVLTTDGHPHHPLRLAHATRPVLWQSAREARP